jgi:hypothetical protein
VRGLSWPLGGFCDLVLQEVKPILRWEDKERRETMDKTKIIASTAVILLAFGATAIDNAVAEEGKVALKPGWKVKGIYNEACASG